MQEYFSALVKIYSRYGEQVPAPLGLSTPSTHLDLTKWQHFPTIMQIKFSVAGDGTHIIFKVACDGMALECARMDFKDSGGLIQFSVKSPSMSCKYMDTQKYMRRFQLTFNNESDFIKACTLISNLGVIVKEARPSLPEGSRMTAPGLQTLLRTQCSSQTPLQTMQSQQPMHENSFSQSQWASGVSTSFFERRGFAKSSEQSFKDPNLPLTEFPEPSHLFSKQNEIPLESPKILLPLEIQKKVSALTAPQSPANNYPLVSIPLAQSLEIPTTFSEPLPSRPVYESIAPPRKEPVTTTVPPDYTSITNHKGETNSLSTRNNKESQVLEAGKTGTHPLTSAAISQISESQGLLVQKQNCPSEKLNQNKSSNMTLSEVKISKKLIKKKLKDKDFLKWVSKVEAALKELMEREI